MNGGTWAENAFFLQEPPLGPSEIPPACSLQGFRKSSKGLQQPGLMEQRKGGS